MPVFAISFHQPSVPRLLALAPNCSSGIASSSCNLYGLLDALYVIAGVLAAILIAVIAFAVHAWRKTKETEITRQ